MRMLRRAAIFLGLIAVLAVGVVSIRLGDTLRQDEAVLGWSNALVSKEFGTTSTPRFLSQTILDDPRPNVWVVSGEIALPDSDDGETWDRYVAVVRQVCNARLEKKCWALESLELGGEGPITTEAGVSRDRAVAEIQLAVSVCVPALEVAGDGHGTVYKIGFNGSLSRRTRVDVGDRVDWPESPSPVE